jgi:tetratricopeptide (TPR) repeat protein
VALVAATIALVAVTHDLYDLDQWQHLTVGRFIWEQQRFPTTQLWTWPTYGASDVDYAWGFEALVWPFWKLGGLIGLQAWRWLSTLAAFGLAWAAARRMGARGLVPLVVASLCVVIYRSRSQVRPETIAAVLLAAEVWLLEARRHGARIHPAWLVLIAWIWANTHISYYVFFVVLGIHLVAAWLPPRRAGAPAVRALGWTGLAALGISFVNPWGWRTLWQPFEFWLVWRHELIYQHITELRAVDWSVHMRDGLPLLLVLWPALALLRARRPALDRVELMMCAVFTATLLVGQRFTGVYALVAAVYVGRDLDEWTRRVRLPARAAGPWARAGLAAAGCLLVTAPDLMRPEYPIRIHFPATRFPVGASDFIQAHDLRGRIYNQYDYGGYLCFRFWPERDRLPFMGIHQEGSRELRELYVRALSDSESWRRLEGQYEFDILVVRRLVVPGERVLGMADGDTNWVRVFGDDGAHVYVRRHGRFARLAGDSAYTVFPADPESIQALGRRTAEDTTLLRRAERELWREVAGSPYHAQALGYLANIALGEARWDDARRFLEEALRIDHFAVAARERLGLVALRTGHPREALRWFEEERRVQGYRRGLDFRRGQVAQAEGDLGKALAHYRRELRRDAGNREVRDSVESVSRRLRR